MHHETGRTIEHSRSLFTMIALLCWLIPIGTVIVCATWSMRAGLAPVCFPLLDGCLSISAACRSEPVVYLFRITMIPMSLVLIWFWILNNAVLRQCAFNQLILRRSVLALSISGSLFLVLYVLYLGTDGAVYELLRRIGIYVFFGGTGIAQLLTTIGMRSVVYTRTKNSRCAINGLAAWRIQVMIVIFMLVAGPLNLLLKELLADSYRIENIIEWNFGLAMFCWYGLQALLCHAITKNTR